MKSRWPDPDDHATAAAVVSHIESIENFWETLKEIEAGSVRRLSSLAAANGWEVIFLTKRPRSGGAIAQVQTQRWLRVERLPRFRACSSCRARGVALPRPWTSTSSSTTVRKNCLDVVMESKSQAILVWRDRETPMLASTRRLGIAVVKSVTECLDALAQVDSPELERPSIVDRVMRLGGSTAKQEHITTSIRTIHEAGSRESRTLPCAKTDVSSKPAFSGHEPVVPETRRKRIAADRGNHLETSGLERSHRSPHMKVGCDEDQVLRAQLPGQRRIELGFLVGVPGRELRFEAIRREYPVARASGGRSPLSPRYPAWS